MSLKCGWWRRDSSSALIPVSFPAATRWGRGADYSATSAFLASSLFASSCTARSNACLASSLRPA